MATDYHLQKYFFNLKAWQEYVSFLSAAYAYCKNTGLGTDESPNRPPFSCTNKLDEALFSSNNKNV